MRYFRQRRSYVNIFYIISSQLQPFGCFLVCPGNFLGSLHGSSRSIWGSGMDVVSPCFYKIAQFSAHVRQSLDNSPGFVSLEHRVVILYACPSLHASKRGRILIHHLKFHRRRSWPRMLMDLSHCLAVSHTQISKSKSCWFAIWPHT